MVDLVIRNARMVLETGMIRGGLAVENGKICALAKDEHLPEADSTIDADSKILLPGLIDSHAHINDPSMSEHEEFKSGSRAAAAGGITTFVDMPLTNQVDTVSVVEEKIKTGNSESIVDFTFYGGMMNSQNVAMIPELIGKGIHAFKAFTCEPYQTSNGVITQCLSSLSELGGHLTVHSEDQGVLDEFKRDFDEEWDAPVTHSLSRPHLAEQLAIKQMVAIAENTGGHLHIAHVTTSEGLKEVERGKLNGQMVTTEVCAHHLMFERDEMNRLGPKSKLNPPFRTRRDRSALWSGLLRGTIDLVVSDHAPCPIEKKEAGKDDIRKAWSGADGIQIILRVLLSEGVNKGRLSYSRLARATSRNPARIFGLYPRKGTIMVGSDADIVLVDPKKKEKVTADIMFSKCGWTLYEGIEMIGVPDKTFVRGVEVFSDNEILAEMGHGAFQPMGSGSPLYGGK